MDASIMPDTVVPGASTFCHPQQAVKFVWESRSIRSTFLPAFAEIIPQCPVVVILPALPFWVATAMSLHLDINKTPFQMALWLCGKELVTSDESATNLKL